MGNKTVDKEKYTQKDFAEKIIAVSKNFIAFNVMDYLQELENTQDARLAIVSLIHSKLKQDDKILLTQKDISSVDDEAFEPFILAVLEKDIEVKKIFDEMDCRLPAFERFASAYKQCWEDIFRAKKKLTQSITDNNSTCSTRDREKIRHRGMGKYSAWCKKIYPICPTCSRNS